MLQLCILKWFLQFFVLRSDPRISQVLPGTAQQSSICCVPGKGDNFSGLIAKHWVLKMVQHTLSSSSITTSNWLGFKSGDNCSGAASAAAGPILIVLDWAAAARTRTLPASCGLQKHMKAATHSVLHCGHWPWSIYFNLQNMRTNMQNTKRNMQNMQWNMQNMQWNMHNMKREKWKLICKLICKLIWKIWQKYVRICSICNCYIVTYCAYCAYYSMFNMSNM